MTTKIYKFTIAIFLILIAFNAYSQPKNETLKVITYNIWNGYDFGNDEERRSELNQWMKNQQPSIIGLQELCKYSSIKLSEDAKKWGHEHSVLL